jgi:hypothetical protein
MLALSMTADKFRLVQLASDAPIIQAQFTCPINWGRFNLANLGHFFIYRRQPNIQTLAR